MNEYDLLCELLTMNNIPYHTSDIYDEYNNKYNAIWFDNGHIEFDINNNVENIVTY